MLISTPRSGSRCETDIIYVEIIRHGIRNEELVSLDKYFANKLICEATYAILLIIRNKELVSLD